LEVREALLSSWFNADMAEPEVTDEQACEECGYSRVGRRGDSSICPECGSHVDPAAPWIPQPMPSVRARALRLCGPALGVAALFVALSAVPGARNWLVWPLWLEWIAAFIVFGWIWPNYETRRIARAAHPHVSRRATARAIFMPALAFNAAVLGAALVVFWALL
jgi:hypothetical protein